jgi:hypothetical protein
MRLLHVDALHRVVVMAVMPVVPLHDLLLLERILRLRRASTARASCSTLAAARGLLRRLRLRFLRTLLWLLPGRLRHTMDAHAISPRRTEVMGKTSREFSSCREFSFTEILSTHESGAATRVLRGGKHPA